MPQSIYYGDTIEVSIDNIVPSGAGFFSNVGINEGFREGMSFLALPLGKLILLCLRSPQGWFRKILLFLNSWNQKS